MWWLNVFRSRFIGFDKKPRSLAVSPVGRQCSPWNILHITHRMKISFTSPRSQSTETWKTRKHARLDGGFIIFLFLKWLGFKSYRDVCGHFWPYCTSVQWGHVLSPNMDALDDIWYLQVLIIDVYENALISILKLPSSHPLVSILLFHNKKCRF